MKRKGSLDGRVKYCRLCLAQSNSGFLEACKADQPRRRQPGSIRMMERSRLQGPRLHANDETDVGNATTNTQHTLTSWLVSPFAVDPVVRHRQSLLLRGLALCLFLSRSILATKMLGEGSVWTCGPLRTVNFLVCRLSVSGRLGC